MAARRTKNALTLEEKKEILDAELIEPNKSELARHFDLPRETIRNVCQKREQIEAAITAGSSSGRMRLKPAREDGLEQAVLKWFK